MTAKMLFHILVNTVKRLNGRRGQGRNKRKSFGQIRNTIFFKVKEGMGSFFRPNKKLSQ